MAGNVLSRAKALLGRPEPGRKAVATTRKPASPYHAVCIIPGARACAAVEELRRKRFLSREAPTLPLRKCNVAACECRYGHFEDRRNGQRRARDFGVSVDGYDGPEHRVKSKRGRRKGE